MNPTKLIGIILIAAGALGLVYGGFSYTKETTGMKLGPIELKVPGEGKRERSAVRQRGSDCSRRVPAGRGGAQMRGANDRLQDLLNARPG